MEFIQWLTAPQAVLSDSNKTKVCIITDINKAQKLLFNRNMNTVEFDFLYDKDIYELETLLFQMQLSIEHHKIIQNLKER